jgi:hypothetical protein
VSESFKPGDEVIWWKRVAGEFVFPIQATVLAVTDKRVKIEAEDPDEDGSGRVVRHVAPENLQLHGQEGSGRHRQRPKSVPPHVRQGPRRGGHL